MTVLYRGSRLFYTDEGQGPAVIFLHGLLENHNMWGFMIKDLKSTHRVIFIDLPGHGESEVLREQNSMEDIAEALRFLLDKLEIKKVYIVGHSMGGYVGLAYAKEYPIQTLGLFLMNSTPEGDTLERKKLRKHGIEVAQNNYEALVKMSVGNLFSKESREKYVDAIEETKIEALKTPLQGYIASQKGMMEREDLSLFWAQAKFKRAMLLGADDTLINAEKLYNAYSNRGVKVDIVKGGHMAQIENTSEVVSALLKFII